MVSVTFEDELEVNATLAAYDDRLHKMGRQLATLREQRDSPSNAFAVECTQAAIRHTMRAKLAVLAAVGEPVMEHPAEMTYSAVAASWSVIENYQGEGR